MAGLLHVIDFNLNYAISALSRYPHSRVAKISLLFNRSVSLDAGALVLKLHTTGVMWNGEACPSGIGAVPSWSVSTTGGRVDLIGFSGANVITGQDNFNTLADGVYAVEVVGSKVHDAANANITADNETKVFYVLFGDTNDSVDTSNGDGSTHHVATVNSGDKAIFDAAFNNPPNYDAGLDYNGSGSINSGDSLEFHANLNHPMEWDTYD